MSGEDRLTLLLNQLRATDEEDQLIPPAVTGIDFIQVVDPADQTILRVFFLIEPNLLASPIVNIDDLPVEISTESVVITSISGGESLATVPVVQAIYQQVTIENNSQEQTRIVLEIQTAEPGDFSLYQLTINSADNPEQPENRIDRFFNGITFSFKQGCPSPLDCKTPTAECPPETLVDFPVDYLARDFVSLRNALLDFAAQRYPNWGEKIVADAGVMLAEVMAALGDELSYIQDRYAREAYWETATQRRSLRHHARLIDYSIDEGLSASTFLSLTVRKDASNNDSDNSSDTDLGNSNNNSPRDRGIFVEAGSLVWAPSQGEAPVPFELGEGLFAQTENEEEIGQKIKQDLQRFWVHSAWNCLSVHVPDEGNACLPVGTTELFLQDIFPTQEQLPEGENSATFWIDKWFLLETNPEEPSIPARRHLVRLVEVEQITDPLYSVEITRIKWQDEQALPFEICLRDLVVRGNLVYATAGETISEYFVTGASEQELSTIVNSAIERQGPLNEIECQRSVSFRYSLSQTETRGLGWLSPEGSARPEIELQEVDPITLEPFLPADFWCWRPDLLDSTRFQDDFTLEDGTWRQVIGFRRIGETITHADYASGSGFTIRFGDGEFGRIPQNGTVFQLRYRTGPGTKANIPADTITNLTNPINNAVSFTVVDQDGTIRKLDQATIDQEIEKITNPFPITNGRDPEDAETVKQLAPEAFRALTFRAVRPEDYAEIAERLPWVQRAGARFRWTGSWLTSFVTADPLNAFELSSERRTELTNLTDCVRQVGREVYVRNPRYLNLDLEISFCVEPFAYPGQVQARVREALLGVQGIRPRKGFFDPDNFTFGTPLKRSALEATIQSVAGVRGVEQMRIRARGITDWRIFEELIFTVGADQIIRLRNNPNFPEQGSLRLIPRLEQQTNQKEIEL